MVAAALVAALLVGELVSQVVDSGTSASQREHESYLAAVLPLVADSQALAADVESLRSGAAETGGRPALERLLSDARSGARSNEAALAAVGLGPPSPRAGALLNAVLAGRARGLAELSRGIGVAIGSPGLAPDAAVAGPLLAQAGATLQQADAAYRSFIAAVRTTRPRHPGTPAPARPVRLPSSRWIADPANWQPRATAAWAAQLSSTGSLRALQVLRIVSLSLEPAAVRIEGLPTTTTTTTTSAPTSTTTTTTTTTTTAARGGAAGPSTTIAGAKGRHRVSTTTTTLPPVPTTSQLPPQGSTSVLPPTGTVAVVAVVADTGNVAVPGTVVTVTVSGASPGRTRGSAPVRLDTSRLRRLGTLAAGAARYLSLPSVPVHLGGRYTVSLTLQAPGVPAQTDRVRVTVAAA